MSLKMTAAVVLAVGGAARAQTDLYIGEYNFQESRFSAVRTDGSNARTLFLMPPDRWLVIGATFNTLTGRVLWLDASPSVSILSANTDGSGLATVVNTPGYGRGASLDAQGRVYFSVDPSLMRVNADGSGLVTLFTSTSGSIGMPRVDAVNAHVYIGANGRVLRMNLDGSDVKTIVQGVSTPRTIGLDVAAGYIYWADANTITDFVGRAKLDGSDFKILIDNTPGTSGSSGLVDMVVDPAGGSIYLADDLRDNVRKYPIGGGGFSTVFTSTNERSPSSLVLSTGEPAQAVMDCNANGIPDAVEIAGGAADCDNNGYLDECQASPACPERSFLLDTGSDALDSSGRAVGAPGNWQVFQAFDVPARGAEVLEIGLDGFMTSFITSGPMLTAKLFADNGTMERPNESTVLGTTTLSYRFSTSDVTWVYAPMHVTLSPGRYWLRVEANSPGVVGASANHGFTGIPSLSRGSSGSFMQASRPVAVRIVQTPPCLADFDLSGFVDTDDFDAFVHAFELGTQDADFDGSGFVDTDDFDAFVHAFEAGC